MKWIVHEELRKKTREVRSMQKSLLKIVAFLLVVSMVFTACTSGNSNNSPTTQPKNDTQNSDSGEVKPVTLDIWIHGGYVDLLDRWGEDDVSKYIQEKTGVTLNISTGDGTNDSTKLNLLVS